MKIILLPAILALTFLMSCDNEESARTDETRAKLVGTWLREADSEGVKSRRVLSLGQEGKFVDRVHATSADGQAERLDYAGEWAYDGANLKRRYYRVFRWVATYLGWALVATSLILHLYVGLTK